MADTENTTRRLSKDCRFAALARQLGEQIDLPGIASVIDWADRLMAK